VIEYKGYVGVFEFDESVEAFHGHVVGIRDVVTFVGQSVSELKQAMADSVQDYLEYCAELGQEPERPYRGEFMVRTTPELHRAVAVEAERLGTSMNAWVVRALEVAVKRRPGRPARRGTPARTKGRRSR
jgi:predicted HicB family RNase H-like nuclease